MYALCICDVYVGYMYVYVAYECGVCVAVCVVFVCMYYVCGVCGVCM